MKGGETHSVKRRAMTRLQTEQKEAYREKLLRAAQSLFRRQTYSSTSIDDITRHAGVSRTTFYRHFRSKLEIVAALTDRLVEKLHLAHDVFLDRQGADHATVIAWIDTSITLYRANASHVQTVREASSIEPVFFRDHALLNHEKVIRLLGRTLPAFRLATAARGEGDPLRIRALLLIRQLDALCYDVVIAQWTESLEVGSNQLASQFMAFLAEYTAADGHVRPTDQG